MAVAIHTVGINTANAGTWNVGDIISQLDSAFNWLGWHGPSDSGLAVGISSQSGGGIISGSTEGWYDIEPIATTGIGTGASFFVDRSNTFPLTGQAAYIHVNRPGYGYTGGEVVTLSAADIGGGTATDLNLKLIVPATISNTVSYAVTFTSVYNASGTDRNGVVSGTSTTITIREGDTLTLVNNNGSSVYAISICRGDELGLFSNTAENYNYVVNASTEQISNGGSTLTWTPLWGQAGTYYVRSYNNTYAGSPTIVVLPANPADISVTGFGSTTEFYKKSISSNWTYGILKHEIDSNKKYGTTYRCFGMRGSSSVNDLYYGSGSSYFPYSGLVDYATSSNSKSGGHGYPNRFAGSPYLDVSENDLWSSNSSLSWIPTDNFIQYFSINSSNPIKTGGNTTFQLDLRIYRSSIDPKFAVFSFYAPTKSSTHLTDNTFGTFFLHNFTTDVWDLDNVFLSGMTQIEPGTGGTATDIFIGFRTFIEGMYDSYNDNYPSKRSAEFGYDELTEGSYLSNKYVYSTYEALTYPQTMGTSSARLYYRPDSTNVRSQGGNSSTGNDSISSDANYNAVIKGIPLSTAMVPCPYYLPDDFVLIQFDFASPSTNIQQGDTITISGSEVYTVITGSYNQTTRTRGILFCARTV